jgi:hypothetical protein
VLSATGSRAVHRGTERALQLSSFFKASVPRGVNEIGEVPSSSLFWRKGCLMGERSKIYIQITPGLVKSRQTTKTFNKGKKIVWGKRVPGRISFPFKAAVVFLASPSHHIQLCRLCSAWPQPYPSLFSLVATDVFARGISEWLAELERVILRKKSL